LLLAVNWPGFSQASAAETLQPSVCRIVDYGVIYVGSDDGNLYALE